ncbi:pleckstrin homology domain-containing family N member 1 isoform X2 [Erinaceus europaeus]|uniref:Pleckstrin homology domain-containing family N member 1 isoform X2 n=1 Tax=Erinaceus europaeus TaxID=9365 RepID=A0ABM3Y404_ERIEU|nr:pleckstrin homology domain-containing family N member 1 isoform X2 [Erinaceus europaeus]
MGNSHCVPQAPRRLRASFSRKPSLKGHRDDSTRKLAGLCPEVGPDGDAADKIFYYIPGSDIPGLESQRESLEQPILSVFRKGRRQVPVRNLGKVVHYSKVQLRFQHSQDTSDCYLELFPSHLYFQAVGSEGLTFQGLLPLTELSLCPLEGTKEHGFQITSPLPTPLLVLCPSQAELGRWLYHLDKQMTLVAGLRHCHSAPLQRRLSRLRTASGRLVEGSAICASRVKLQHLPAQEQWDRLLILYPTSLAIFSEEAEGLCFKGELPLSAVHINLEEKDKQIRSFLIEGPLINSIRVLCATYEDYSRWLLCLQELASRDTPSAPPSLLGLRLPAHAVAGALGSLPSDGRASWDSGCPATSSAHTSQSLPDSCHAQPAPEQDPPGCSSITRQRAELRRGGSSRSPRSKVCGEGPGPAPLLHLDLTKLSVDTSAQTTEQSLEAPHSPLYADPYTPPATTHHRVTDVRGLDQFISAMQSSLGPEPSNQFPRVPVSVPVTDPQLPSRKGPPPPRTSLHHRGSFKGRAVQPPGSPQLVSSSKEESPQPLPPPADSCTPWSYDIWDKALSPSHQRGARRHALETEGGLIQWI